MHAFALPTALLLLAVMAAAQVPGDVRLGFAREMPGAGPDDIAVAPNGWVYIVGATSSPDYVVTSNAFDRTCGTDGQCDRSRPIAPGYPSQTDAFLTVLDGNGVVQYSTFLGGSLSEGSVLSPEYGVRVAVSPDGEVWVAGMTTSTEGFDGTATSPHCDGHAIWIGRFDRTLSRFQDFQCLAGSQADQLGDIVSDDAGNLWMTGFARSPDFPLRDARQSTVTGFSEIFLSSFHRGSREPAYSTFIGGSGADFGMSVVIAGDGDIVVAGSTDSPDFPLVRPIVHRTRARDAVVVRLDASRRFFEYATNLGGTANETAFAVVSDPDGHDYVIGETNSPDFPVTSGAFETVCSCPGRLAGFITAIEPDGRLAASTFVNASRTLHASILLSGSIVAAGHSSFMAILDAALTRLEGSTFTSVEGRPSFLTAFATDARFAYMTFAVGPRALGNMFVRKTPIAEWHHFHRVRQ